MAARVLSDGRVAKTVSRVLAIELGRYARLTAADNECKIDQAIRYMLDEPGDTMVEELTGHKCGASSQPDRTPRDETPRTYRAEYDPNTGQEFADPHTYTLVPLRGETSESKMRNTERS